MTELSDFVAEKTLNRNSKPLRTALSKISIPNSFEAKSRLSSAARDSGQQRDNSSQTISDNARQNTIYRSAPYIRGASERMAKVLKKHDVIIAHRS